jgi:hypothetical protein
MDAADALPTHPGPLEDAVLHARALVEGRKSAMADYEARKKALAVIDFGDMVTNAARLLRENPAILSSVLAEVDCVIVDEFQDTNPIQFTFLWTLARQAKHALIVGDTKQAIMGFQGADPRLTEALIAQFETSPLDRNWRSDPRIMALVNALGPKLFGEGYTALTPQNEAGSETALEVIALGAKRNARTSGKPQHFVADRLLSLLEDETVTIIDRHSKQPRPLEARDIAILCPAQAAVPIMPSPCAGWACRCAWPRTAGGRAGSCRRPALPCAMPSTRRIAMRRSAWQRWVRAAPSGGGAGHAGARGADRHAGTGGARCAVAGGAAMPVDHLVHRVIAAGACGPGATGSTIRPRCAPTCCASRPRRAPSSMPIAICARLRASMGRAPMSFWAGWKAG